MSQVFEAASEVLRKLGADATAATQLSVFPQWTGLSTLGSPWVWAAVVAALAAFGTWLVALRHLDLGVAFVLGSVVHIFVAAGSWLVLGEHISPIRAVGILFIVAGLVVVARSQADLETRTERTEV
ncbi:MAG: EamA family transporter [Verrucomicrobia bacterium]|nr:EamA family transporter [Verrucomicrobiota bacterium]